MKDANSKDGKLDFIMCTFHPIFGDNVRIIDTECNTTTLLNIFIDDTNLLFVWLEFFPLPWLGFPRPIPPKSIHPTLLLQPAILVVIISCNTCCHYFFFSAPFFCIGAETKKSHYFLQYLLSLFLDDHEFMIDSPQGCEMCLIFANVYYSR